MHGELIIILEGLNGFKVKLDILAHFYFSECFIHHYFKNFENPFGTSQAKLH